MCELAFVIIRAGLKLADCRGQAKVRAEQKFAVVSRLRCLWE